MLKLIENLVLILHSIKEIKCPLFQKRKALAKETI